MVSSDIGRTVHLFLLILLPELRLKKKYPPCILPIWQRAIAPTVQGPISFEWLSYVCTNVPYSRQQRLLKSTVVPVIMFRGISLPQTNAVGGKMFSQNIARYTILIASSW
eukprot:10370590-Ditylum_brightwellii.AAC.1